MSARYTITTLHGETLTVWCVMDTHAPDEEQPAIVESFTSALYSYSDVKQYAEWMNDGAGYGAGATTQ